MILTFSLCGVLEIAFYFSESFSEAVAEAPRPLGETVVYFLEQKSSL